MITLVDPNLRKIVVELQSYDPSQAFSEALEAAENMLSVSFPKQETFYEMDVELRHLKKHWCVEREECGYLFTFSVENVR